MQNIQNEERPSAATILSPARAENLNENSEAKDSCAAAPCSAGGVIYELEHVDDDIRAYYQADLPGRYIPGLPIKIQISRLLAKLSNANDSSDNEKLALLLASDKEIKENMAWREMDSKRKWECIKLKS